MAADGQIRERVYRGLKQKLVEGEYGLGQHLDLGTLSRTLKASPTPVKEALVRLSGERLVIAKDKGFQVARWSTAQLGALYLWREKLILLALESAQPTGFFEVERQLSYAVQVRQLFGVLDAGAGDEIRYAATNADDRLGYARLVEPDLWPDVFDELEQLYVALSSNESAARIEAVRAYFSRRLAAARAIRDLAILRSHPNGD